MNACSLSWNKDTVQTEELRQLFSLLGEHCPLTENGDGVSLSARLQGDGLLVTKSGGAAQILAGSISLAARGVGMLLSGLVEDMRPIKEKSSFKTVGVMFDC